MKFWGLTFILITLLLVQNCSAPAALSIPPQIPDPELEAKLRSILPNGWTLSIHDNTFTFRRNEKVWLYVEVCWDLADYRKSLDERIRKYGTEEKYEIKLRFEPKLTDAELQQLKLTREPYEKIVDEGGRSSDEWYSGIEEFYKHAVPVFFTDKYSVFAEKSNDYPRRMYPESAEKECQKVLAALDSLFKRYREKKNRDSDF